MGQFLGLKAYHHLGDKKTDWHLNLFVLLQLTVLVPHLVFGYVVISLFVLTKTGAVVLLYWDDRLLFRLFSEAQYVPQSEVWLRKGIWWYCKAVGPLLQSSGFLTDTQVYRPHTVHKWCILLTLHVTSIFFPIIVFLIFVTLSEHIVMCTGAHVYEVKLAGN